MPPFEQIDMSTKANNDRFDRFHPEGRLIAGGADNNGHPARMEGEIYVEDVRCDIDFSISVLLSDEE